MPDIIKKDIYGSSLTLGASADFNRGVRIVQYTTDTIVGTDADAQLLKQALDAVLAAPGIGGLGFDHPKVTGLPLLRAEAVRVGPRKADVRLTYQVISGSPGGGGGAVAVVRMRPVTEHFRMFRTWGLNLGDPGDAPVYATDPGAPAPFEWPGGDFHDMPSQPTELHPHFRLEPPRDYILQRQCLAITVRTETPNNPYTTAPPGCPALFTLLNTVNSNALAGLGGDFVPGTVRFDGADTQQVVSGAGTIWVNHFSVTASRDGFFEQKVKWDEENQWWYTELNPVYPSENLACL